MNVLAYVHLRNIVRSTGAGRVARQITEHLATEPGVNLRILADPEDHRKVIAEAGQPWTAFSYAFIEKETSAQQTRWFLMRTPTAESYWPEVQITYCTAESYVPATKSRLAVTVHDAAIFEEGAHRRDAGLWKQRLKWKLLYGVLARKADMFHTVSQFSADRLAHHFPAIQSRLRVVPNAVAESFWRPLTTEGRDFVRGMDLLDRQYVLLPGGLHYRKNAELVLSVWPKLAEMYPDLQLVVVNHSDPAYMATAKATLDRVRFAGFVSDEALSALYQSASVVWFPSRYEGFGMPVLEAMASGTPVVASDSSSIPEVAGGAALLASPVSVDEHIDALRSLLDSESARTALSVRGRERASRFTWRSAAMKLREEFEGLL